MPINWRLAAPEVRYILEHSEARVLVCDDALVELANDATKGMESSLAKACVADQASEGWAPLAALRADAAAVVGERERSRVTTVWLAPAMVNAIMALPDVEQRDLPSVRVIINGGEKMPSRSSSASSARSRPRGSPMPTGSPRPSPTTRSSIATAS